MEVTTIILSIFIAIGVIAFILYVSVLMEQVGKENNKINQESMGKRNPGKCVTFGDQQGIIYTKDQNVGGKIVITLTDKDWKPIIEDGKPKQILKSSPEGIRVVGFVD